MNDSASPPPVMKWSAQLDVDQPLSAIAPALLEARLARVTEMLTGIGEHSATSDAWVHQLRVATRRAQAAIDWFAVVLGQRRRDQVRRKLRGIRHAANAARNLDVLIADLTSSKSIDPADMAPCLDQLRQSRQQAQQPLTELLERLLPDRWPRRVRRLLDTVRWRHSRGKQEPTLAQHASAQWQSQCESFTEELSGPLETTADLHRLRIATKRLRYAAELAMPAIGASFPAELYEQLTELQGDLGAVNDHATAVQLLHDLLQVDLDQPTEPWGSWIEHHRQQLNARQRRFHRRWPTSRLHGLVGPPHEDSPLPPR